MRLPKLANWLSEGDLEKYRQKAQQASATTAQLQKTESELTKCQNALKQAEKELAQAKAQLQINQGFQIELGETQLKLRKSNNEAQGFKKELFERQKQLNIIESQLDRAKQSLSRSQNWTQYIKTPVKIAEIKKTLPKENFDTLWGFGIISPKVDFVTSTGAIAVKGWVLGKKSQIETLRVIHQAEQILETRVDLRRPGIAEQYPDIPMANKCGFEFCLSVVGITRTTELQLKAVLQDLSIVPLCAIILQPETIESKDT